MVCAAPYVVVVARAGGSILHSLALGDPHTGRWATKKESYVFFASSYLAPEKTVAAVVPVLNKNKTVPSLRPKIMQSH